MGILRFRSPLESEQQTWYFKTLNYPNLWNTEIGDAANGIKKEIVDIHPEIISLTLFGKMKALIRTLIRTRWFLLAVDLMHIGIHQATALDGTQNSQICII